METGANCFYDQLTMLLGNAPNNRQLKFGQIQ